MGDPKSNVRYLGFHPLPDGSRRLDFSFSLPDKSLRLISVEASHDLFTGPDHMAIQECVGICYEALKFRVPGYSEFCPASITLTPADVAQHRKPSTKSTGSTKKPKQS